MPLAPSNSFAIFFFWLFVWSTAPLSRPDNLQPHHRISSILTSNHESPLLLPQIIWTPLRSLDAKMLRNSGGGSDRRAERERERERDETRRDEKRSARALSCAAASAPWRELRLSTLLCAFMDVCHLVDEFRLFPSIGKSVLSSLGFLISQFLWWKWTWPSLSSIHKRKWAKFGYSSDRRVGKKNIRILLCFGDLLQECIV